MKELTDRLQKFIRITWILRVISALAAAGYTVQIWLYAHSQDSILDDGLYMLKGYLFTTGRYRPFEAFGPWTNKMPFSFLIPGYFQKVFGPGLRVGRYYAIGIALLFLVGAWLAARRLGGSWGSAITLSILALNPASLKLYAMTLSEGLIAAMLVWTLVLVLGEGRPAWQLLLGACLAGLIPVTRINMAPVLPFTLAYIFWEHGFRLGLYAAGVSLVPLVGTHILYWPGIMKLSVRWLPDSLTPFLDRFRVDFAGTIDIHDPVRSFKERYMSFLEGLRFHFPAILSVVSGWILWPKNWEDRSRYRAGVYLSSLFFILFIMHGYASLLRDSNVFAFSVYLSFFEISGILFLINTFPEWKKTQPPWKLYLITLLIIGISLGVFYSYAGTTTALGKQVGLLVTKRSVMFESGRITFTDKKIWEIIQEFMGWKYATTVVAVSVSILLFLEGIIFSGSIWLFRLNKSFNTPGQISYILVLSFIILAIILSPSKLLGGGMQNFSCHEGVIAEHEKAAINISEYISNGDRLFWVGSNTQSVMLEIMDKKEITMYPQQFNSQYSFRVGGDADYLAKHGYWNDLLAENWFDEADIVLIEKQAIKGWFGEFGPELGLNEFDQVESTDQIGCFGNKSLTVYRRTP